MDKVYILVLLLMIIPLEFPQSTLKKVDDFN